MAAHARLKNEFTEDEKSAIISWAGPSQFCHGSCPFTQANTIAFHFCKLRLVYAWYHLNITWNERDERILFFLQVCACNQARCCGEWKIRTDKPFQTEFLDSWLWYVIKSISIYITNLTTIKFSSRKKLLEGSNDVFHELSKIFILNEQQWKNEARFSYWKWFLHLLKTKWQTNKRLHFKWINSFHDNKVGKRW